MAYQNMGEVISTLNLNSYEAKVWAAILSRGISSAGEIADISKVPRSRCYDVLESLEKKGFVFTKVGKPIKYIAVSPDEVINIYKKQADLEQKRLLALFDSIKETEVYTELNNLYSTGIHYIDNNEISQYILGKQNINLFLKKIFSNASKNIMVYTTKSGTKRKLRLIKSVKKTVPVTIFTPNSGLSSRLSNVKLVQKNNALRFIQIDDDQFVFYLTPEDIAHEYESILWIKSNFMAKSIKSFFE